MYIIIIGARRIGRHLAKTLHEEQHDVVVIDKNQDVLQDITNEADIVAIRGDATSPKILEEAGIGDADAVLSLTGNDQTNLIISLMAKQLGCKYVAARLGELHYDESILTNLGLDLVIYPEAAAAGYIAELVTKPEVLDLAFLARGDAEILEIEVKPESKIAGRKIKEDENPQGTAMIAIFDKGKLEIPGPNVKISAGDKILILAKKEKIKQLRKIL